MISGDHVVKDMDEIAGLITGGVLSAVSDVGVHQLLLSTIGENPPIVERFYANDAITILMFGGATAAGLLLKNDFLTSLGLGGLLVETGEEVIEHLGILVTSPAARLVARPRAARFVPTTPVAIARGARYTPTR